MILHLDGGRWYLDVRSAETNDQMSFHLACTLPRRLAAGRVVVLADNTKVFLSVIRKRWMKLLHEVECQRASTLDRTRKQALQYEADQMRDCVFASKPPTSIPNAHVYFLAPGQMRTEFPPFMTLFVASPLSPDELACATASLKPGGLAVIYKAWQPHYVSLLKQACNDTPAHLQTGPCLEQRKTIP